MQVGKIFQTLEMLWSGSRNEVDGRQFFSFPMQHVGQIGGFVTEKKVENLHFLIKYCVYVAENAYLCARF